MDDALILAEIRALRGDMNAGHKALSDQMDKVSESVSAHQLEDVHMFSDVNDRLRPLETLRSQVKWGAMTLGAGLIGALVKKFAG